MVLINKTHFFIFGKEENWVRQGFYTYRYIIQIVLYKNIEFPMFSIFLVQGVLNLFLIPLLSVVNQ